MKKTAARRCAFLAGFLLLMPAVPFAQKRPEKKSAAAPSVRAVPAPARKAAPAPAVKAEVAPAPGAVRFDTSIKRDPFFNYALLRKNEAPDEEVPRGEPPPGIAGMYMAKIKLLGIVSGDEILTAVFGGTDRRAYFLQEKDQVFDGYIKKIEADSVLLIRETRLRSGKVVTQEVIKRLRTP
jgi:hypothetical protein